MLRTGRTGGSNRAARVWTGVSVLLAALGVGAMVLLPGDADPTARLGTPAAVLAPLPPASGSIEPRPAGIGADQPGQLPAGTPVRLQVPALGVATAVTGLGLEPDGSLEVPAGAQPVGWYEGGPTPGEIGPAVLAGHVDWAGERGAFYGLRELRPGDAVVVDRADGTAATFRVDRVETHDKDQFPTEEVYGDLDHAGLRLITCGGAFDEGSGEYRDNVIVFATLVSAG